MVQLEVGSMRKKVQESRSRGGGTQSKPLSEFKSQIEHPEIETKVSSPIISEPSHIKQSKK